MRIERHPDYCKELAYHGRMGLAQCTRRPKRDGYCAQHHPEAKAAREAASRKAWDEQSKRRRNFEVAWGLSQATDEQLRAELARREAKGGGVSAQQHTDVDGGAGADAPAPFSFQG